MILCIYQWLSHVAQWTSAHEAFCMAALTFGLVLCSVVSCYIGVKGIQATRRLEEEKSRPYVVFETFYNIPFFGVRMANVGQTPAYNISVESEPIIWLFGVQSKEYKERPIAFMNSTMPYLAPSGKIETELGNLDIRINVVAPGFIDTKMNNNLTKAEKDDIAIIMRRYGIDWLKKDTHNKHLSVLDYKKQERAKEVAALEQEIEDLDVVIELREEKAATLDEEIERKRTDFRMEQSKAQKELDDALANKKELESNNRQLETDGIDLQLKNSRLRTEYYEALDRLTDKKNEIDIAEKEADKWKRVSDVAKWEAEHAQYELAEAEKLKQDLLGVVDGDAYLKEQVIELRYQNQVLQEENRNLKDKLEKAYEFMKQFVIGGMNLLEKFKEWIGEKIRDVKRER